jgi:hypothetical protein
MDAHTTAMALPAGYPMSILRDFNQTLAAYRSANGLGLHRVSPFLKSCVDVWIGKSSIGAVAKAILSSGANRLFGFSGGDWRFLCLIKAIARKTRLEYDIYITDDYESAVTVHPQSLRARYVRLLEASVLRGASRVFGVSEGYVDHLWAKYGITAGWLPYVCDRPAVQAKIPGWNSGITFVYIGSINHLYEDALEAFCETLRTVAKMKGTSRASLTIVSLGELPRSLKVFASDGIIRLKSGCTAAVVNEEVASSNAVLIPYSFHRQNRVMVSTSFPTKIVEAIVNARPIISFGPEYSSMARYVRTTGIGCSITSRESLFEHLNRWLALGPASLEALLDVDKLCRVWAVTHSPDSLRSRLLG